MRSSRDIQSPGSVGCRLGAGLARHRTIGVSAFALFACSLLAQGPKATDSPRPNAIGMEFVKVMPGEFTMGCSDGDDQCAADEQPAHRVQITKHFEMGKYEVTQAQWRTVMGTDPSTIKGENRPVETVSRTDAQDFLDKLNARNDGYRYRLPTEAEWEYAARAGTAGPYAGALDDIAWYAGNSGDETHPVGQKKPNQWGLYDMEGNVREWVSDWYSRTYYSSSPAADPPGPATAQRGGPPGGPGRRGGPGAGGPGGRGGPDGPGERGGAGTQPDDPCPAPATEQLQDLKKQVACLQQEVADLTQQRQAFGPQGRGPRGGGGLARGLGVMRGGGWDNLKSFLRVSSRYNYYGTTLRVSDVGFRVVREPVVR
jgi:formylglycine-generating enzyme required for sulfatase activity